MRSGFVVSVRLMCVFLMVDLCVYAPSDSRAVQAAEQQVASIEWAVPTSLYEQLDELSGTQFARWVNTTRRLLDSITQISLDGQITQKELQFAKSRIALLRQQSGQVNRVVAALQQSGQLDNSAASGSLVNQLYQVRYCLERRLAVWSTLLELAAKRSVSGQQTPYSQANYGRISFAALDSEWREYFLLGDVSQAFNSLNPDRQRQKQAARRTLGRMFSPALKSDQKKFVEKAFDPHLVSFLKQAASDPVNVGEVLHRIELHERHPNGATEFRLNDLYQDLVWSEDATNQKAAEAIHDHYRNANVRLSVSEELLNRLVPEIPSTREKVSDRMLGAAVSGQSYISNRLEVELVPDPNQVQLRLQTMGTVRSNTVAHRDGFAIQNQGLARFQVFKRLAFGREGIDSSAPVAYSTADQQVVGMRSRLDGVPLVGRLARKIASQKIREQAPKTKQIVRSKVEREASERMQVQVEEQLQQMRNSLNEHVLQPLLALELEPEPVQMSTTRQELVMRYRLAGRDQMAASTARPAAVPGSLCSCQIHESMVNNTIMRMGLNGNEFTAEELKAHFQELLGSNANGVIDDEEPQPEAQFKFAPVDPLRVRLNDQKMTIELNLASMKIGGGKKWQRLRVSTSYVPHAENGTIVLEQSGDGIRLKGKRLRFRDQVALRTVFEVMFQSQYRINLLTPKFQQRVGGDLSITQLALADGWLGVSIDDQTPEPATMPAQTRSDQPRLGQAIKWAKEAARRSRQ